MKIATRPEGKVSFKALFEPRNIAVIGSFKEVLMGGYGVTKSLLDFGFSGNIYPVNPVYSETLGMKVYPTADQVPDVIDLAIIVTPPSAVPTVIGQCAQRGAKAAIIVSDGFAEASKEGAILQHEVVDIAHRNGMRLIGPNTIGIINTANGLVTTPYFTGYDRIQRGAVAYSSQTGIIGAQALPYEDYACPVSKMCDFGNKCDLNEIDLLEYLADDPETKVIAIHTEDIKDGRKFMDVAQRIAANKPVLVLKPGRNEASAKAVASHTGSLAGNDQIYENAFKQAGVIRVDTWQEFLEIPKVFASQPLPQGNRIAVFTVSGAAGIMAIDAAAEHGLIAAQLSSTTTDKLSMISPRLARNPVDAGQVWTIVTDFIPTIEPMITTLLGDSNVDCILLILWTSSTAQTLALVDMFQRLKPQFSKPMTVWLYGPKLSCKEELSRELETLGVPTYLNLETAAKALGIAANCNRR